MIKIHVSDINISDSHLDSNRKPLVSERKSLILFECKGKVLFACKETFRKLSGQIIQVRMRNFQVLLSVSGQLPPTKIGPPVRVTVWVMVKFRFRVVGLGGNCPTAVIFTWTWTCKEIFKSTLVYPKALEESKYDPF